MKVPFIALAGCLLFTACNENSNVAETSATAESPASAAAEEGFILAIEGDMMPEGKVMVSNFSMAVEGGTIKVELPDQELEGTLSVSETKHRKVEAIGERKYRYTLVEDRKTEQSTMMGTDQPVKETVNPLEGLALIAELDADGSWTIELESGEPTAEIEKELEKIADELEGETDVDVYGTVPRHVGDEWEVSGSDMMGMKDAEGSMTVKFEGIEEFQGERCARLTGTMDLTGAPEGDAPEDMKMRMTGEFVVLRSLEHRVDLQNKISGRLEVFGDLEPQPGMKMSMKMEGPLESVGGAVISDAE